VIASEYDSAARHATRTGILDWYRRNGTWPPLERLLAAESIARQDQAACTDAASLTAFLLDREDQAHLLEFALAGRKNGWKSALRQIYHIDGIADLHQIVEVFLVGNVLSAERCSVENRPDRENVSRWCPLASHDKLLAQTVDCGHTTSCEWTRDGELFACEHAGMLAANDSCAINGSGEPL